MNRNVVQLLDGVAPLGCADPPALNNFRARGAESYPNTPACIDDVRQQFHLEYDAGNALDLAGLFANDAVLMPQRAPAVVGWDAIRSRYAAQFALQRFFFCLSGSALYNGPATQHLT